MKNKKREKRNFWDRYKTYEPEMSGYGGTDQWKQAFRNRFFGNGFSFYETITEEPPIQTNGDVPLEKCKNIPELQKEFRKLMMKYHPDIAGDTKNNIKKTQNIIVQYENRKKILTDK